MTKMLIATVPAMESRVYKELENISGITEFYPTHGKYNIFVDSRTDTMNKIKAIVGITDVKYVGMP